MPPASATTAPVESPAKHPYGWPAIAYSFVVAAAVSVAIWPVVVDLVRQQKSGEIDPKEAMAMLRSGRA